MNPELKRRVTLSFWRSLKNGVCTSYRSDATIVDGERWPEITSALSIRGLLYKPTRRDYYIFSKHPIIHKLFEGHLTNLSIYDSSNPFYEIEDEDSKILRFDHAGEKIHTEIFWSIDEPSILSRILNDARNANYVTVSIALMCSDSFFDLSDPKLQELDEYGELEVHQNEINIKRIELVFE